TPSVSPCSTDRLTLLTACTMPSLVRKLTLRSLMSSNAMSAILRVEGVAQAVAHEEEAEKGDDEEEQRKCQLPQRAVIHRAGAFRDQRAPRGQRLLHAETEETDEAFGQDHQR